MLDCDMELHQEIKHFIEKQISLVCLFIPQNYPAVETFEKFQEGYKYNGVTGEILDGTKPGHFKENWYVICSNDYNDPFYVDLSEQDRNFPVYFSWHGSGNWEPVKVAEDLNDFAAKLLSIQKVEQDADKFKNLLETDFDLTIELWKEVYASIDEEQDDDSEEGDTDMSEWIKGKVVVRDIGQHKMKIVHFLKTELNLTLREALAVVKQKDIEVYKGYLVHLKDSVNYLKELGATAEFVAD
ncbi:SMI1/KNR4 family protein [Pedobacter sp. NJ-S-72]